MQTQDIEAELCEFVQYAAIQVESGNKHLPIEEPVRTLRESSEFAQAVADVGQGVTDDAHGKSLKVSKAFLEIRRKLRRETSIQDATRDPQIIAG